MPRSRQVTPQWRLRGQSLLEVGPLQQRLGKGSLPLGSKDVENIIEHLNLLHLPRDLALEHAKVHLLSRQQPSRKAVKRLRGNLAWHCLALLGSSCSRKAVACSKPVPRKDMIVRPSCQKACAKGCELCIHASKPLTSGLSGIPCRHKRAGPLAIRRLASFAQPFLNLFLASHLFFIITMFFLNPQLLAAAS